MRLVGAHQLIPAGLITQIVAGEVEWNPTQLGVGEGHVGTASDSDRGTQNKCSTTALENL